MDREERQRLTKQGISRTRNLITPVDKIAQLKIPLPPYDGEVCLNLLNNWNARRRRLKAVCRQDEIGLEWDIDLGEWRALPAVGARLRYPVA